MKVAILGYAVDGVSSAKYFHEQGHEVTICDQNSQLQVPDFATPKLGEDYLADLDQFDILVRTPGLHPREITKANPNSSDILSRVTSAINEFFKECPAPILAVTGTKGKGTTSTLISRILHNAGKKVFLGGNIGTVPLDFLHEVTAESFVVLELSNFQLIDFKHKSSVAVCLMMVPEHQDWHTDLQEYYLAKENLFKKQTDQDITVYSSLNELSSRIANTSQGHKIPYTVPEKNQTVANKTGVFVEEDTIYIDQSAVCNTSEVALRGRHNLENVCAAIGATWEIIEQNSEIIKKTVAEFSGLEHRIEFVKEVGGVSYFNDSFATTPEATIAAIRSFEQPKILILGGSDKGIPFYDLATEVVKNNVRKVIIIGQTGPNIIEQLVKRGYENIVLGGKTMAEMVNTASREAQPGDVVLLSTACASFDLFKNYKDRGTQFKDAVNRLS